MPSTATVTAKTGPASQATALVISNVVAFTVNPEARTVQITGTIGGKVVTQDFDLSGTLTFTISGNMPNLTITISIA